jgi:isopentenyldiphosphate isomerase
MSSGNASSLTLIERILALDRSSELAHLYTPLILYHPNQAAFSGVDNLKCAGALSASYVAVGHAQTSLVDSTLLHCKDDNDEPIFVKGQIPNRHGLMTDVLQLYMDIRVRQDVISGEYKYDHRQLFQKRTTAFEHVADYLIFTGVIPRKHTDLYPIYPFMEGEDRANKTVLAHVNRNMAPYLGIDSVGVHLNCYVKENNRIKGVWLAKRASIKSHHYGYWDCTVAGGHPINLSLVDNIVKESQEEAGVPAKWILQEESSIDDDSDTLFSDHTHDPLMITTAKSDGSCMKRSLYYSCDLQVPHSWTPTPVDGEVSEFRLYSMKEVEEELRFGDIVRPSIRAVLLDFMIRHEHLKEEDNINLLRDAMRRGRLLLW